MVNNFAISNFTQDNILEELELAADAASGQKVIAVINSNGAEDSDFLVLNPGNETGELIQIATSGVSGNNITASANLALNHKNHERVIKLFGDKIQLYRAPNVNGLPPDFSSFIALGLPVAIDPDQLTTDVTDNSGGSDYWYLYTYVNSQTSAETSIQLAEPVRGGNYGDYCSEEEVLDEAGIKPSDIDAWRVAMRKREAEDEVKSALAGAGYVLPLQTVDGTPFVPELVAGATRRLAAGLLLIKNFGTVKPGSAKNGAEKCDMARETLAKIQLNDLVLLDPTGAMLSKPTLVTGWPDSTTADDGVNIGPIMTMDKKF